jgi:hypothetical protein
MVLLRTTDLVCSNARRLVQTGSLLSNQLRAGRRQIEALQQPHKALQTRLDTLRHFVYNDYQSVNDRQFGLDEESEEELGNCRATST